MIKAFRKGLREVRSKDVAKVREEIREVLGIGKSSRALLAKYIDGKMPLEVERYHAINDIFKRYGINNPWGTE